MWPVGRRRLLVVGVGVIAGLVLLTGASWVLFDFGSDPGACACSPTTTFGFAENETAGTVTITHEGGRTAEAGKLVVAVGDRRASWATRAGTAARSNVGAGDSLTVRAQAGETLRVVWQSDDGDRSTTLATYTVGE